MKFRILGLTLGLLAGLQAQAQEVTVFDAAEQCQVRATSTGDRYIPPCTVPNVGINLSAGQLPDALKSLGNSSSISYNFSCESLRPFSIQYQIMDRGQLVQQGSLSPQASTAKIELNDLSGDSQFMLTGYNGLIGFQAIKPGCQLTLLTNELPDSQHINILQNILVAQAKVVKPLLDYDRSTYEARLDEANEWLRTIYGFVALSTQPQMSLQMFDLMELFNQTKSSCVQGVCSPSFAEQFEQQYLQYKKQLLELRDYLQQQVDILTKADDIRAIEYQNLLTLLNLQLSKL